MAARLEAFVSPEGGVWVPLKRFRALTGRRWVDVRRELTHEKALYRGVARAQGWMRCRDSELGAEWVVLPRPWTAQLRTPPQNFLRAGPPPPRPNPAPPGIELYPNQELAVQRVLAEFSPERCRVGAGVCYLEAQAGSGKTVIGCEVIRRVRTRAAAVAPRGIILEQWQETAQSLCAWPVLNLSSVSPEKRAAAVKDSTVVIISTQLALTLTPDFWSEFGLVVFDEAHFLAGSKWRDILWRCTARRILGLSATPRGREDECDQLVEWHLGTPVRVAELPGYDPVEVEFRGELRVLQVNSEALEGACRGPAHEALQALHNFPPWRALVVSEVRRLIEQPSNALRWRDPDPDHAGPARVGVLVFCENREAVRLYLEALRNDAAVGAHVAAPEEDVQLLYGGCASAALNAARSARIVVTTFGYLSVGASIDHMTAIVYATTRRRQLYQIMCRAHRHTSDQSVKRQHVLLCGPRRSWREHARAMTKCAKTMFNFGVQIQEVQLR